MAVNLGSMNITLGLDLSKTESEREGISERGKSIRDKMVSSSVLDSENHPLITFTASKCRRLTEGIEVIGFLGIRGTSRQVLFNVLSDSSDGLVIRGHFKILHSDFDMDPYFGLEPYPPFRPVVVNDMIGFYFKLHSREVSQ